MSDLGQGILAVANAVSVEKGIDQETIFEAMEQALAASVRKNLGGDADVQISIDRTTGDYRAVRRWLVVDDEDPEFESPQAQVLLSVAEDKQPGIEVGAYLEEPIDAVDIGRISAHAAKQVIVQKVREAERAQTAQAYADKVGHLLTGLVKRNEKAGVYVDLGGNAEGFIPSENTIQNENVRMGSRLRAYLREIREENRGPQLILSRTAPEFLIQLFHLEVPEIEQGLIEIVGAAREPGLRAKIAVRSHDSRLDPVGACIGMRGARVQAVSNELSGERIDIITWHANPAQYVLNALSLSTGVEEIVEDEENRVMDIAVDETKKAQAIGMNGQNVRLAGQLTGWNLNVLTAQELHEKVEQEQRMLEERFQEALDVDEHIAAILVENGFREVREIVSATEEELLQIEEFGDQIVAELKERAGEHLVASIPDDEDILKVEGMNTDLAMQLAMHGITTRRQLAELASDELPELPDLDEDQAGELILKARAGLTLTIDGPEKTPAS